MSLGRFTPLGWTQGLLAILAGLIASFFLWDHHRGNRNRVPASRIQGGATGFVSDLRRIRGRYSAGRLRTETGLFQLYRSTHHHRRSAFAREIDGSAKPSVDLSDWRHLDRLACCIQPGGADQARVSPARPPESKCDVLNGLRGMERFPFCRT